jgi:Resolvase, N terminal domain
VVRRRQRRLRCGAPRRRRRLPPSPTKFNPAPQHRIAQAKFLGHRSDRAATRSHKINRLPLVVVRKRPSIRHLLALRAYYRCPSIRRRFTTGPLCARTLQSDIEVRPSRVLLQHENSNDIALNCATTKRHTVVCPLDMERVVAYLRVSTQRQHRSGLGIDAQRDAIQRFAESESRSIIAEFVEVETGKGSDALERRPHLAAALSAAKAAKCSVVVSKLDRLSRDVAFVAGLMAQRVPRSPSVS